MDTKMITYNFKKCIIIKEEFLKLQLNLQKKFMRMTYHEQSLKEKNITNNPQNLCGVFYLVGFGLK